MAGVLLEERPKLRSQDCSAAPLQPTGNAAVAPQPAHNGTEKAATKKGASSKKGAPTGKKAAKQRKPETSATALSKKAIRPAVAKTTKPRRESKGSQIIELISRPNGATLPEIMTATGWLPHSVRGFISTAGSKKGFHCDASYAPDSLYTV